MQGKRIAAVVMIMGWPAASLAAESRVLFDFANRETRGSWVNVNDNVMGGVSQGRYGFTSDGKLRFYGTLSLANNGGFASVRSRPTQLNLRADDEFRLMVRGDGRKYNLDLRVPSRRTAFAYRVTLQTKASQWLEFRVPISLFAATSFGRVVSNAGPVDATAVHSLGFTLSDKKAGPFQLDVAWIRVMSKSQ